MNEIVYPEIKAGLYIVLLPIGWLSDNSFRAYQKLSNSDFLAGADSRNVKWPFKLLKHKKSMERVTYYHNHSSLNTRRKIIDWIKKGNSVALVCDAGTPLISDPGYKLVNTAIEEDL